MRSLQRVTRTDLGLDPPKWQRDVMAAYARSMDRTPALCPECARSFSGTRGLRQHVTKMHGDDALVLALIDFFAAKDAA